MFHVTMTTPLKGWFVIFSLGYGIVYLCTKFDHSIFSRVRDMVGFHQNLNGSRDLTMTHSGTIVGLGLATFNLPTKFEVYLPSLRRY